jgi:hypothetical protein
MYIYIYIVLHCHIWIYIWYIHDMYTSVFIAPQRPPSTPSSRRSWDQRLPPTELWQLGSWQSVSLQRGIRNPRSQNVKHYERIETYWNNAFLRSHNNCNHKIRLECIVKKPQELNCSHMRKTSKEAVSRWLSAHTCDAMNLPSKLLNSNSFAATRRVKHLQPLCRNLWDAGQLMWLDGLKSCTPSTTMSQYVIYSLTLKIRRNCRNWIIRHDPFPLQLVPVPLSS